MLKENDILSSEFLDFQIFALSDEKTAQTAPNQSNQFTTLVVYQAETANEALEKFLFSILTAAKLDMSKDVFLQKVTKQTSFSFIRSKTNQKIEKVLLFGIAPNKLGIHLDLKKYQAMFFQDCTFLFADDLAEIQTDVAKKRALWTCLQEIYLK